MNHIPLSALEAEFSTSFIWSHEIITENTRYTRSFIHKLYGSAFCGGLGNERGAQARHRAERQTSQDFCGFLRIGFLWQISSDWPICFRNIQPNI